MKKLLIGTTALVSIMAGAAFADTPAAGPNVKVGGVVEFQYGSRHQKQQYKLPTSTANQKSMKFNNDARVFVKADAMADAGFKYGAVATLATTAQSRMDKDSNDMENTYVFLETNLGRLEAGSNYGAARTTRVDASSFARASGGIGGDWMNFVNLTAPTGDTSYYLTSPGLLGDANYNNAKESTRKVTFYTPRMSGFQVGLSYTPDTVNTGDGLNNSALYPRQVKNQMSGGLSYSNQFDQVAINLSAVGEMGTGTKTALETTKHNLKGWEVGGSASVAGFTAGGSWGTSNKKFNTAPALAANNKNVKYWDAGVSYVNGPVGVSLGYFNSNYQNNKAKVWSLGLDYQLAPGMLPYVEATSFDLRSNNTTLTKNRGNVYLVGTQLRF
jgi:hypothetical protein